MATCVNCGEDVPTYKKDYRYSNGSLYKRAGEYSGSVWMKSHDKNRLFCTLRCAALYGIKSAEKEAT